MISIQDWSLADYDQALELIHSPDVVSGMVRVGADDYPPELPNWDRSISYLTPMGGWYFEPVKNRIHQAHVLYRKEVRGEPALEHSRAVFEDMKRHTDRIIGEIGLNNRLACRFVECLGCRLVGRKTGDYWIGDQKTDLGLYVYEFKKSC